MAQLEIDTPLTGSQVQAGFSVTGWTDQGTNAVNVTITVTSSTGVTSSVSGSAMVVGNSWTFTTDPTQVPAGSTITITVVAVATGGGSDSDTVDDIQIETGIDDPTNPLPIDIGTIAIMSRRTTTTTRMLQVKGHCSKKPAPNSVVVEVVVFHGKQKSAGCSTTTVSPDTTTTPFSWSASVLAPVTGKNRQIIRTLLLNDKTRVIGQATSKVTS
jgi:hypothetical protein